MEIENTRQFESRKEDHIRLAMSAGAQADTLSEFHRVELIHDALPEMNLSDIDIKTWVFEKPVAAPIFVSSMTAGHARGQDINLYLASAAARAGLLMAVGSQRRELNDPNAKQEWQDLRKKSPNGVLFGNLGLAQVITTPVSVIQGLVDNLEADGLFIHTNPLQEALQLEGTPQFRGGLSALEKLCSKISVPVVLKEVGCGFSTSTLKKLHDSGIAAVDVAGSGGTHWGRLEILRSQKSNEKEFFDWGISTVQSLINAEMVRNEIGSLSYEVWASGGVRSGLDVAKCCALGAKMVGIAQPFLVQALHDLETGENTLEKLLVKLQQDLKIAMFCSGCETLADLESKKVWQWK